MPVKGLLDFHLSAVPIAAVDLVLIHALVLVTVTGNYNEIYA